MCRRKRAGLLRSGVWCGAAGDKAQVLQGEVENGRTGAVDVTPLRREMYPV